jgi:helicase
MPMKFEELDLEPAVVDSLRRQGYSDLYPPQEDALPAALKGKSIVLAVPTASGKSLVAYLSIVSAVLKGRKAVYIVPLRALASEKFEDLKRFEDLGVRVALSIGDYDAEDQNLERFDVIVATSEKIDSLLRHRASWLEQVSVVVADEIHLMNDPNRGPTLEVTLTKFKMINPKAQIIALSATVRNSKQIAEWLGAAHFTSEWRPVPLKEGIYVDGRIFFSDNSTRTIRDIGDPVASLVQECLAGGGQSLVFVNTRRSSESLARTLRPIVKPFIEKPPSLRSLSKDVSIDEEEPTSLGHRLSECIRSGVAFHNAGLTNEQRRRVEESFRTGKIKCIVATPTLAAGINLPARTVIIREMNRYDSDFGHASIPVLEIKQMCGRAGRPKYDKFGEAILVAKDEEHKSFLLENYLLADPEDIFSKLGTEPALRSHILAAIATKSVSSEEDIMSFIEHSFLAVQTEVSFLEETIRRILSFLEEHEMIRSDPSGTVKATFFGRRVSDLYLDPASAVIFKKALDGFHDGCEFGILHALASTTELQPLYLRRNDSEWVEELLEVKRKELLLEPPDDLSQYEFFLAEVKTASLLLDWIQERSEEEIEKKFGIGPGDIRNKMDIAQWMAYSLDQMCAIFRPDAHARLEPMVKRITKGVKTELLEIAKMKNVGRVRARALHDNGLKTIADLREADVEKLARIPTIGQSLAIQLKRDLGQESEAKAKENEQAGQKALSDF